MYEINIELIFIISNKYIFFQIRLNLNEHSIIQPTKIRLAILEKSLRCEIKVDPSALILKKNYRK
jgi:hypothetical protein